MKTEAYVVLTYDNLQNKVMIKLAKLSLIKVYNAKVYNHPLTDRPVAVVSMIKFSRLVK